MSVIHQTVTNDEQSHTETQNRWRGTKGGSRAVWSCSTSPKSRMRSPSCIWSCGARFARVDAMLSDRFERLAMFWVETWESNVEVIDDTEVTEVNEYGKSETTRITHRLYSQTQCWPCSLCYIRITCYVSIYYVVYYIQKTKSTFRPIGTALISASDPPMSKSPRLGESTCAMEAVWVRVSYTNTFKHSRLHTNICTPTVCM